MSAVAGPGQAERAPAGQTQPSPPADASTEAAVPPSAFAAAAAVEPAVPGQQEHQERRKQGEGRTAGQAAVSPSGGGGLQQVVTAPSRQATGLTAFYTASEELPPPPGQQAQQAQQVEESGAAPTAATRGRVQVVRVAADGQPLPAVVEGSSVAGSCPPSSASYSADRSSSEDAEVRGRAASPGNCASIAEPKQGRALYAARLRCTLLLPCPIRLLIVRRRHLMPCRRRTGPPVPPGGPSE